MMRSIKFRAWDKSKELLVNAELILGIRIDRRHQEPTLITYTRKKMNPTMEVSHLDKIYCNEFELMQYTGLKDKNSVEIYEGDIVLFDSKLYPVAFKNGNFGVKKLMKVNLYTDEMREYQEPLWNIVVDGCEVIGNIYEHHDLLGDSP